MGSELIYMKEFSSSKGEREEIKEQNQLVCVCVRLLLFSFSQSFSLAFSSLFFSLKFVLILFFFGEKKCEMFDSGHYYESISETLLCLIYKK